MSMHQRVFRDGKFPNTPVHKPRQTLRPLTRHSSSLHLPQSHWGRSKASSVSFWQGEEVRPAIDQRDTRMKAPIEPGAISLVMFDYHLLLTLNTPQHCIARRSDNIIHVLVQKCVSNWINIWLILKNRIQTMTERTLHTYVLVWVCKYAFTAAFYNLFYQSRNICM